MQAGKRVMLNTVILYANLLVTMAISLYSVRLVLHALGASDYGLYALVSGVIAMLAFLNASMTVATQRFMSVFMGSGDKSKVQDAYRVSILLHVIIAGLVVLLFEGAGLFLFDGFLNIPPERIHVAKVIYQFLVVSMLFTILSVPFEAMINANEHFLAYSLLSIFYSLLKLALALLLMVVNYDKLVFYAAGITVIAVLDVVSKVIYNRYKYPDISVRFRSSIDWKLFKDMFSFAGYNTLSSFAIITRNQGIAVVLNLFFGTVINAAYGIANQINGVLSGFSSTLQKSINPQLMKSEGAQNRDRMLNISFVSSKFSVLVLGYFAIPLIVEMPYVLNLWLKDYPEGTIWLSRLILILSLFYQFSVGLMSAIQSVGKIKRYTMVMCMVLLLNIPVACLLLWMGLPAYSVVIGMIFIELVALFVRLKFAARLTGLDIASYMKQVIVPTCVTMAFSLFFSMIVSAMLPTSFVRLVFTSLLSVVVSLIGTWVMVLNKTEKNLIRDVLGGLLVRSCKN